MTERANLFVAPLRIPGDAGMDADNVDPLQFSIAQRWVQEVRGIYRFDHEGKRWLVWSVSKWIEAKKDEALQSMMRFCNQVRLSQQRPPIALSTTVFSLGALRAASGNPAVATHGDELDSDGYLLNTPDGYVDLKTGALIDPDPVKLMTKSCVVGPSVEEDCPRWKAFLGEAHAGQEDVADWLQKLAGLCCIGDQRGSQFAYFYGTGGNGKSVFTGVLQRLLLDYAAVAQAGTFTMPEGFAGYRGHAQVVAVLKNMRMVVASEPNKGEQWDMSRVKEWTGGNPIKANLMHRNGEPFMPVGFLIMEANEKLAVATVDDAIGRRLRFLVWPHKFAGRGMEKKEIEDYSEVLVAAEGPGILRWIINGAMRVIEDRLGSCETVDKYSDEYLQEQDTTRRFIDLCLERDETATPGVDMRDALAVYNEWAMVNEVAPRKRIGDMLKGKGVPITRSNTATFVRGHVLSETGMKFMTNVLSRKLKDRSLTRTDLTRWEPTMRDWKLVGEDAAYFDDLVGSSGG